jgi:uncharacterized membrane protein
MNEHHTRSVIKGVSWRVIATLTTTGLVYAFTGEFALALEVGFLELVLKLLFYYLHERVWGRIPWGRRKHPLELLPVKQELAPDDLETIRQRLEELGYL